MQKRARKIQLELYSIQVFIAEKRFSIKGTKEKETNGEI